MLENKERDAAAENQEPQETMQPASPEKQQTPKKKNSLFSVLGPGFLAGMAGNDSSAVATYSVNGATNGYGQLWLMLLWLEQGAGQRRPYMK
ncbi:MAG: hypothetical protein M3Y81_28635, partial [Chloroflexota bacterium]|nr:hypothetical protein [Chloroflexota bacterium]